MPLPRQNLKHRDQTMFAWHVPLRYLINPKHSNPAKLLRHTRPKTRWRRRDAKPKAEGQGRTTRKDGRV
jgi:hypothetical protein